MRNQLKRALLILTMLCSKMVLASNIYDLKHTTVTVTSKKNEFTIKLKSNPTTGFQWQLKNDNKNMLMLVSHRFEAPSTTLIGAPGYEVWHFKANISQLKKSNSVSLQFVYARPWEKNSDALPVTFKVRIK